VGTIGSAGYGAADAGKDAGPDGGSDAHGRQLDRAKGSLQLMLRFDGVPDHPVERFPGKKLF
jgi:hypothetical protein